MTLVPVVDALVARLRDELPDGVTVADAHPAAAGDVPSVAVSLLDASQRLQGIGRTPRGPRRGALAVRDRVDLTDPVLRVDGDEVELLSPDRRELLVAHGPMVQLDGSEPPPLSGDDLTVVVAGEPVTVVTADPQPGQVRADAGLGRLLFGSALPATGTVIVDYRIGVWDVESVRFEGTLAVDVYDEDTAGTTALTRQVAEALARPPAAFPRLRPASWGAASGFRPAQGPLRRAQRLTYAFDFDLEVPSLPTGGGIIRRVAVTSHHDSETENFDVPTAAGAP